MQTHQTQKSGNAKGGFWSSKLGAASIASIAAMSAMVILSSQVQADPMSGTSNGTSLIQLEADAPALFEIA
ncbi:MAG: hypothetical protein AAGL10_10370 [Pseudomonadota bacterium]